MNWYDSPTTLQRLAAAYALGTLAGPARRRFEAVMRSHPAAAEAVARWDRRFAPLGERLPPRPASEALWQRIEREAFGAATATAPSALQPTPAAPAVPAAPPARRADAPRRGWWQALQRGLDALLAPVPAAALATGLALGLVLPNLGALLRDDALQTELPESYVGVLATAEGRTGMIVSSLRHGRVLDLKRVTAVPVPAGRVPFLWIIDAAGKASPVGPVPDGAFVRVDLPQPAEALFAKAAELGITHEPAGSQPAVPGGAYVYRGLCGKLWRVPPPR